MMTALLNRLLAAYYLQLTETPSWWIDKAWWAVGVIVFIGAALILLLSKKREDVQLMEGKRADALEKLLKTRDIEIQDLDNKISQLEKELAIHKEDLDSITSEYKTLAGIIISELCNYWQEREVTLAEMADIKQQNRIFEKRKGPNK